jgi:phenylalanyl-tRNA synthetase alpha chain
VQECWVLTKEGEETAREGSHEARVFNAVPATEEGISLQDLTKLLGQTAKFGQGPCFKAKWIVKTKTGNFKKSVETIEDKTQIDLLEIEKTGSLNEQATIKILKKRNLIQTQKTSSYNVKKDVEFTLHPKKEATDITIEMLQSY